MTKFINEQDVIAAGKQRNTQIHVSPTTVITPAAIDAAQRYKIKFVSSETNLLTKSVAIKPAADLKPNIIIGADHGGFKVKEILLPLLNAQGYFVEDVGTFSDDAVDYPDYAYRVAKKVIESSGNVGIMIDGAGIGSAMAANKVPGIRAAACYDKVTAKNSREHNYANLLTLGGRVTEFEMIKEIVFTWLNTAYGEERHFRRVQKIIDIESQHIPK